MSLFAEFGATVWLAVATAFAAGILRGTMGFGSALLLAPVMSGVVNPADAVAISLVLGIAASMRLAPLYLRDVEKGAVMAIGLAGMLAVVPGMLALRYLDADFMRRIIAVVTLIAAGTLLVLPRYIGPKGRLASVTTGFVGGAVMGATSMGGPPIVLYLMSRDGTPRQKKANIIAVVGGLEIISLIILTVSNMISSSALEFLLLLVPVFLIGVYVGERWIFRRASGIYRPIALCLLMIIGVVMASR